MLADAGLLPLLAATVPASLLDAGRDDSAHPRKRAAPSSFERSQWLYVVRLVGVYAAAAAVGTIYVSAVVVVTSLVGTPEESGYLGAAFRIFTVLSVIPLILVSTAFPVLARAAHTDQERLQYAVQRLVDIALIVGTWMALATALGAEVAVDIVAGPTSSRRFPSSRSCPWRSCRAFLAVTGALALVSLHRHFALLAGNLVGADGDHRAHRDPRSELWRQGRCGRDARRGRGSRILYGVVLFGSRVVHYDLELVPRVIVAGRSRSRRSCSRRWRGSRSSSAATVVYWGVLALSAGHPARGHRRAPATRASVDPVRVGINLMFLVDEAGGAGRYALELVPGAAGGGSVPAAQRLRQPRRTRSAREGLLGGRGRMGAAADEVLEPDASSRPGGGAARRRRAAPARRRPQPRERRAAADASGRERS